jgi:hypothetical protein
MTHCGKPQATHDITTHMNPTTLYPYTPKRGDFVTGKLVGEEDCRQGWIVQIHPTILRGRDGDEYPVKDKVTLVDNPPTRTAASYREDPYESEMEPPDPPPPGPCHDSELIRNQDPLHYWRGTNPDNG